MKKAARVGKAGILNMIKTMYERRVRILSDPLSMSGLKDNASIGFKQLLSIKKRWEDEDDTV